MARKLTLILGLVVAFIGVYVLIMIFEHSMGALSNSVFADIFLSVAVVIVGIALFFEGLKAKN